MRRPYLLGVLAPSLALITACGGAAPTDAGMAHDATSTQRDAGPWQPLDYADDRFWLCRPGMEGDECLAADLSATEILADGTMQPTDGAPAATDPAYDCFYVYPTVALGGRQGNVDVSVLDDHGPMLDPLLSQAAWFRQQCRLFAPLYRQITLSTYTRADAETYLENAYVDVAAAFDRFLEASGDRPFVIMGHSQGAHMTRRLMERVIDPDPALRARLIAGLLIGGDVLDDSYENVAPCTADDEVGCVIAYRTYAEGYAPPSDLEAGLACTSPTALAGGEGTARGSYFPLSTNLDAFAVHADVDPSITTAFVLYRDLYAAECVPSGDGQYLEVRVRPGEGDVRTNPVPFDHPLFAPGFLGLHVLDYNFFVDDLLRVVGLKAAAMGL